MGNFKYFARIAGVLFIVCAITAVLLGAVYGVTKDTIAANDLKTMKETISAIYEGNIETEEAILPDDVDSSIKSISKVSDKETGELLGYAVYVAPIGFKAEIEMIVGLEPDGSCKSVRVLSMSETPGLGSKITEDSFLSQFAGKKELFVVKENITPIASATISSKAVTQGVNTAMDAYKLVEGGNVK